MRICFFSLLLFAWPALHASAQGQVDTSLHAIPPSFKEYQFSLPEKAIEIKWIEYEKTKVPMHGKLSPDGRSILIRNYQTGQPLRVKAVLENGKTEEYVKSPCFIDPVIDAL